MKEKKYVNHLENLWNKNRHGNLPKQSQKDYGEILITDYLSKRAASTPEKPCLIY